MRLWTIQTLGAFEKLRNEKILRTNAEYAYKDFLNAYNWMDKQMERKLNILKPSEDCLPLWAWYQWDGERRKKPDLRYKAHLPSGEIGYRIEFEIDDDRVLLSDFELFHYVLNYWYLPGNEKEDKWFEESIESEGLDVFKLNSSQKNRPKANYFRGLIEQSWDNIFDLDWHDFEGYVSEPKIQKSIQATFWELEWEQVRKVERFIAR